MPKIEYPKWLYHWDGQDRIVQNAEEHKALGKGWADSPAEYAEFRKLEDWARNELSRINPDYASGLVTVLREKESWQLPVLKCIETAGRTYFLFPPSASVSPGDSLDWTGGERWVVVSTNNMSNRITVEVRQIAPVPLQVRVADAMTPESELDDRLPLCKRKIFDRNLPAFLEEALRRKQPLSLLMLDLDNFKAINDQHGHPVGDEVLVDCTKILTARIEGKGKAYRYGGEEFAMLLPNFSPIESEAIAEMLRRSIENSTVGNMNLKVTISIGVACLPDHANDAEGLLRRADAALYQAKRLGRNLVRVSGEPEEIVERERKVERRQPTMTS